LEFANCIGYIFLGDFHHAKDMDNWLSPLLVSSENLERTARRALGLLYFAWYAAAGREDNVPTRAMLEESISICEGLGDRDVLAYAYLAMALTGNNPADYYEKAVRLFRETRHTPGLALTLLYQGWFHPSNDQRLKRASLLESQSLYGELGYIIGRVETLKQLGAIDLRLGDFASAQRWLDEAQSLIQDHRASLRNSITVSYDLGDLAYFEGRYELAQKQYEDALAWANQIGVPWSTAWADVRLGYLHSKIEAGEKARLFLGEALHTFQKLSMETGVAIALEGFAMLAVIERQWEKAVKLFSFAEKQREQFHSPRPPVEQAAIERELTILRANLTETEFSKLSAEGSTMTMEQAVALALEE
jgi:tetratricopeptide (TPR) repeat protein